MKKPPSVNVITQETIIPTLPKINKYILFKEGNFVIKPSDLKIGLRQKISELKAAYQNTLWYKTSFIKKQSSILNKYNHEFITEFVEKNFVEASLFDPAIDYSETQNKELVLEAKTKVTLFLNEYQNACYSCDIERTKKLTAMFSTDGKYNKQF